MADDDPTDAEKCAAITEAAIQTAQERCGDPELVKEQLARMTGMGSEPDPDCDAALAEGLNEETMQSPTGTSQWVFCRAWRLFDSGEADSISSALERSWAEARNEEQTGITA